jgi:hypothetical protein
MAISSWNAGIIRPVAVAPDGPFQDGAAPGVWTLDQVAYWQKQGLWPVAGNVNVRGLFGGGNASGGRVNIIDQISIGTTGNATDFGDLSQTTNILASCSSSTRGLFAGGNNGSGTINSIEYVTILSAGNAANFGNLTAIFARLGGLSNATIGIFASGETTAGAISNLPQVPTFTVAYD